MSTQQRLRAQQRLRSAWASTQSDQSSLCAQWVAKEPSFLHVDREDWSDWADAQADLSLLWAHMPLCWFCHEAAQVMNFDCQGDCQGCPLTIKDIWTDEQTGTWLDFLFVSGVGCSFWLWHSLNLSINLFWRSYKIIEYISEDFDFQLM